MPKILVFIGARGGSKGVKNKNIRLLNGKPLIAYTIELARKWSKASKVIVSTDSEVIAKTARDYGAEVPFIRPAELASDEAPKSGAIVHALKSCEETDKCQYDVVVDLDATAPIRTLIDLDACYDLYCKKSPDVLFSVVDAHKNPYFNMIELNGDGHARLVKSLPNGVFRRQDAPVVYAMNASIYFYNRDYLIQSDNPVPVAKNSVVYLMNELSGIDIDREIDFQFIEFLIEKGLFKF